MERRADPRGGEVNNQPNCPATVAKWPRHGALPVKVFRRLALYQLPPHDSNWNYINNSHSSAPTHANTKIGRARHGMG